MVNIVTSTYYQLCDRHQKKKKKVHDQKLQKQMPKDSLVSLPKIPLLH